MQKLRCKGSTDCGNFDSTSHSIVLWPEHYCLTVLYTDYIMPLKARGPVIMKHCILHCVGEKTDHFLKFYNLCI